MRLIFICLLLFFLTSCEEKTKNYSIAMDKDWYSLNIEGQEANLNGFFEDLLLNISKDKKTTFELIDANWDNLFFNLKKESYMAVFSPIEPFNFNLAKYDFSQDIIDVGFCLITLKDAKYKNLDDLKSKRVGYLSGSRALIFLQKHETISQVTFDNQADMLTSIVNGNIEAAVLSIIPAYKYVSDLYSESLQIQMPLLNDQAIRLVTLKNENTNLLNLFNSSLKKYTKQNKLKKLKEKWGLFSQ